MARRTVAAKPAEPACRLISVRAELQSAPAHGPSDLRIELRAIAAGIAVVALLVFAAIGLVFNAKHGQPRPEHQPADLVTAENGSHSFASNLPASNKPKANVPQPVGSQPVVPMPPVPVEPVPMITDPEVLAVQPRDLEPDPSNRVQPTPVVVEEKPLRGPGGESTRAPDVPTANIPDPLKEKPIVPSSAKLTETAPAIDPRLRTFGTRIGFYPRSTDAIALAKSKEKLVMVLHYAGLFEDGAFVSTIAEEVRQNCLLNTEVAAAIQQHFICSATKISTSRNSGTRNTGSVVVYFCRSNGDVLHAIPSPASAEEFLKELEWLLETRKTAAAEYQKDPTRYASVFKKAHTDRYFQTDGDDAIVPGSARKPLQPRFMGPFGGFAPFGGMPFGPPIGGGFGGPFGVPSTPAPAVQLQKLPTKCPSDLSAQTKVHWLLGWQPLPQIKDVYRRVYSDFLNEKITP